MPRAKRKKRSLELECQCCRRLFPAVREDAQTCGATCRQKLSRAKREARAAHKKFNPFAGGAGVQCDQCGQERDGRVKKCPVCSATTSRKVK